MSEKRVDEHRDRWEEICKDPLDIFNVDNMVITVKLCHEGGDAQYRLNLKAIVERSENRMEYNPKKFANAVIKYDDPKIVLLVFSKGEIVCTAATDVGDALHAIKEFVKFVKERVYSDIEIMSYVIHNIVASARLNIPIDRSRLASENPGTCTFQEQSFPGVIVRLKEPETDFEYEGKHRRITALVFESGSVVVTGSPTVIHAQEAFLTVFRMLEPYLSINVGEAKQTLLPSDTNRKNLINYEARRQESEKRKEEGETLLASKSSTNVTKKTLLVVEEDDDDEKPLVAEKKVKTDSRPISIGPAKKSSFVPENTVTCDTCSNICTPVSLEQKTCCYCIHKAVPDFKLCAMCVKTARFYENPTSRIV